MASQFAHMELWTAKGSTRAGKRRWSAREILAEMSREEGACDHVTSPEKPILLYGQPPMQLADELEATAETLKDSLGRSTASRARVLLAAVYSYPVERGIADPKDENSWAKDVLDFNLNFFGKDSVKSVVAHADEKYFHVHVAVTAPKRGDRLAWEEVHPGLAAEAGARLREATAKQRRAAYIGAMREFQDLFHREVAIRHGHSRTGPRRRRLTRDEWYAEKRVLGLLEKAAGRPLVDVLSAAHWQERYERSEKEKLAALARAETAERRAEKLHAQVVRLLTKLKRYLRTRMRPKSGAPGGEPMPRPVPTPTRERVFTRQRQKGRELV